jgi:acetyl-CoA carboxylase biotin carboxylase subunit
MEHPDFRSGDISIQWLEQHLDELTRATPSEDERLLAAVAAALAAERDRATPRQAAPAGGAPAPERAPAPSAWRAAALRDGLRA